MASIIYRLFKYLLRAIMSVYQINSGQCFVTNLLNVGEEEER